MRDVIREAQSLKRDRVRESEKVEKIVDEVVRLIDDRYRGERNRGMRLG